MFFQRQEKVDYEDDPGQQSEGNKSVAGPILVDVQHLARVKGLKRFKCIHHYESLTVVFKDSNRNYVIHVLTFLFCILYSIYLNKCILVYHRTLHTYTTR